MPPRYQNNIVTGFASTKATQRIKKEGTRPEKERKLRAVAESMGMSLKDH